MFTILSWRQTLKNAERYKTPELSAYESKALDADPPPPEKPVATRRSRGDTSQPSLFEPAPTHPVVEAIRAIELERLTPLEAFDLIRRLREQVE